MRRTLKQGISNYHMPRYMRDILINNYCPCFLSMSIVREDDSYMFSYDTGYSQRLDFSKLSTIEKLTLLRSIIKINHMTEDWLIKAEQYLLEPELLYSYNNSVYTDEIKLLFYPDFKNQEFKYKLAIFIDKIKDKRNRRETELFIKLKELSETGDILLLERTIEKAISRLRQEMEVRAG
ncbi:MAG: hypothetical protein KBS68_06765 [Clostridiales bacterium]|nr:hypothetical protein [Candidatus Crickella merdequi]